MRYRNSSSAFYRISLRIAFLLPLCLPLIPQVGVGAAGTLPDVYDLKISRGVSTEQISLEWKSAFPGESFVVYRSYFERGEYEKIGESEESRFVDTGAEEGIKSWYRVHARTGDVTGPAAIGYGYRAPRNPRGLTMQELTGNRTQPWPTPASPEAREREKLHLRLYEKYYESYFMMTFIFMVGRIYINNGDILAYRGFRGYTWDPANRMIFFAKPGTLNVRFHSKRFFRFVRDMHNLKIPFDDLLPRVIENAVLFCVRSGEDEMRQRDGRIRYIPRYDCAGMGTEYVRDYRRWRGNTIVFATSDENLYRRIRNAQLKGY